MKIYFDRVDYNPDDRAYLADYLRPYINTRSLEENIKIYGDQITQNEVVSSLKEADLFVLTMAWPYYFKTRQLQKAWSFLEQAREQGKPVAVWQNGDFGLRLVREHVWLIQCGGDRTRENPGQIIQPVLISDPLHELNLKEIKTRVKSQVPVIGFCGQAEYTLSHAIATRIRFGLHNLKSRLNLIPYDRLPLNPLPTQLRSMVLCQLEACRDIQVNFIKRKKYRAGVKTSQGYDTSRREFLNNILDSDYTVCVRGTGNFSARLYETLAMGRIPILINTNCVLPCENKIDWNEYCVIVDADDLNSLPQKLLDFHTRFGESDFVAHQIRCRRLWEEHLSYSGFFKHFHENFS